MEQVFLYNVNPSLQILTDNTQRNSADLRSEDSKTSKKDKGRGPTSVDSTEISSEATTLGDDMMGSMDPDMFRKKKHHMRRHQDEEEESPAAPAEETAPPAAGDTVATAASLQAAVVPEPARKEIDPGTEPADERASRQVLQSPEPDARVARDRAEMPPTSPDTAPTVRVEGPHATDVPLLGPVEVEDEEDEVEVDSTPRPAMSGPGLLQFEEGFIIAEWTPRRKGSRQAAARPIQPVPDLESMPISEKVSRLLDDIVMAPEPGPQLDRLRHALARFGAKNLAQCRSFGVRVVLASGDLRPSRVVPRLASHRDMDALTAAYFPEEKLCYLTREAVDFEPEFGDTSIVTFAMALDHAMGGDGFASLKSPAVLASFQACRDQQAGHHFLDRFCASSAVHYFAQAVEAYLTQTEGPLREDEADANSYCSRSELYDLDRTLYGYIDYLFRDSGGSRTHECTT